jgi:hypothetical protein
LRSSSPGRRVEQQSASGGVLQCRDCPGWCCSCGTQWSQGGCGSRMRRRLGQGCRRRGSSEASSGFVGGWWACRRRCRLLCDCGCVVSLGCKTLSRFCAGLAVAAAAAVVDLSGGIAALLPHPFCTHLNGGVAPGETLDLCDRTMAALLCHFPS